MTSSGLKIKFNILLKNLVMELFHSWSPSWGKSPMFWVSAASDLPCLGFLFFSSDSGSNLEVYGNTP